MKADGDARRPLGGQRCPLCNGGGGGSLKKRREMKVVVVVFFLGCWGRFERKIRGGGMEFVLFVFVVGLQIFEKVCFENFRWIIGVEYKCFVVVLRLG